MNDVRVKKYNPKSRDTDDSGNENEADKKARAF